MSHPYEKKKVAVACQGGAPRTPGSACGGMGFALIVMGFALIVRNFYLHMRR